MAGEPRVADPVDPLHALSGISLFPRTIRASADAPFPSDPNDLDSVHNFIKSMALSSPERALDEAKVIVDRGPELMKSKFGEFLESLGIDTDAVALEEKQKPQERRQGLGRKRARFSLKPATSPLPENLEPSFDIGQLQDPAEFFSAYEKLENVRKEIRMQKGEGAPHSDNYNTSMNMRQRRPGILGKSASYKHRYSYSIPEDDDLHMSSQELPGDVLHSQSYDELHQRTNTLDSQEEIDVEGSVTNKENKINEILDELLSKESEDLDGDGALSFLQEQLQIKPIDLENLSVLDFDDIHRTDFKALGEKLPRARKAFSNISNLAKKLSGGTPKKLKQGMEAPLNFKASPTPPRSPFASISLLKKRNLQSGTQKDPFSPPDVLEPKSSYLNADIDEDSHQVSVLNEPDMSGKPRADMEDGTYRPQDSDVDIGGIRGLGLNSSPADNNIDQQVTDTNVSPHRSQSDMLEQHSDIGLLGKTCDPSAVEEDDTVRNDSDKHMDNVGDEPTVSLVAGEAFPTNEAKSGTSSDMYQSIQVEGNLEETHSKEGFPDHEVTKIQESANMNTSNGSQPLANEVTEFAAEENHRDVASTIGEISAQQNLQKSLLRKQHLKTKKPRIGRREKAHPLRPSLAAAGTSYVTGVRRSTRIKTRPLEYWKGERLLYGRVNDSVKVVGLKYISPGKGDGKLKVKHFVSDEYKELVELAAAH